MFDYSIFDIRLFDYSISDYLISDYSIFSSPDVQEGTGYSAAPIFNRAHVLFRGSWNDFVVVVVVDP